MRFWTATDYDRSDGKRREYLSIWSGPFADSREASAASLPGWDGYMLTVGYWRDKVRVSCPAPRTEENYRTVDAAIDAALTAHFESKEVTI